jgi:hypothetical protein
MSTQKSKKEEAQEKMERKIMEIGNDPEAWEEWVDFRARFHNYSTYNRMVIHSFKPGAKNVMGYREWRKNGRQVRYGENEIPIMFPYTSVAEDQEEADENGVEVGEKYIKGFGYGSVYAWSQTIPIVDQAPSEIDGLVPFEDGHPEKLSEEEMADEAPLCNQPDHAVTAEEAGTKTLPEPIPLLDGNEHEDIFRGARKYAEDQGYDVKEMEEKTAAKGSYNPRTKTVEYRGDAPLNQKAKTTIHEIAHGLTYDRLSKEEVKDLDSMGLEIIAEGTAYMTCYMMGFDTSSYSYPYLRSHIIGADGLDSNDEEKQKRAEEVMGTIKEHLRHIDNFSDEIRDGIMEVLEGGEEERPEEENLEEENAEEDNPEPVTA